MVPQQVSFVERASLSQRVPYQRFHCTCFEKGGEEERKVGIKLTESKDVGSTSVWIEERKLRQTR